MIKKNKIEDYDIQIDLLKLLHKIKRWLWLIILTGMITGAGTAAYTKYIITPQYASTAMVYVLTKETTLTSLADLQIGSQLTQDYKVMISSRPVLEEVISTLGIPISYKELKNKIRIDNPADTRILTLTVHDSNPEQAKLLVNQIALTASDFIGDLMEMVPPKIIEEGVVSNIPTSPNVKNNGITGALLGIMAACGVLAAGVIMDDTVCTEEDVERYLNMPVLAAVPNSECTEKSNSGFLRKTK